MIIIRTGFQFKMLKKNVLYVLVTFMTSKRILISRCVVSNDILK